LLHSNAALKLGSNGSTKIQESFPLLGRSSTGSRMLCS
jgi:hypothetical protein